MPLQSRECDSDDFDPSRVRRGIAAGFMLSAPLWGAILLLMGNQSLRKAVLNLLCLAAAAAAVWIAKAISAETAVSARSERAGSTGPRETAMTTEWISIR